jgi:hypothetical protein
VRCLKTGQHCEIARDVDPAAAAQAVVGLIETGVAIIMCRLRAELQVDAMPLPQRTRPECRLHNGCDVTTRLGARGEHVAVVESAGRERRIEHP